MVVVFCEAIEMHVWWMSLGCVVVVEVVVVVVVEKRASGDLS